MNQPAAPAPTRLSVALCTYNGGRFLREQLASLAAQTRRPDELVISDDGSGDDTIAIARQFAATAPFEVRVHRNPSNLGYVRNFSAAIGLCTGDLVALCDQDDRWYPHKLATCEARLAAHPDADAVFSDARLVDEELRPLGTLVWAHGGFDEARRRRFAAGEAFALLLQRQAVTGATLMFRSRLRDLLLPIPPEAPHDRWIALLVAGVSRLEMIEEPLMDYRQHASNQIGAKRQGLLARVRGARGRRRIGDVEAMVAWTREAQARLRARTPPPRARVMQRLDDYADHLRARAECSRGPLRRTIAVGREIANRRYFRYSNGLASALMDLLL